MSSSTGERPLCCYDCLEPFSPSDQQAGTGVPSRGLCAQSMEHGALFHAACLSANGGQCPLCRQCQDMTTSARLHPVSLLAAGALKAMAAAAEAEGASHAELKAAFFEEMLRLGRTSGGMAVSQ